MVITLLPGSAVITWSWNGRLVSAGSMKVYADDRIEVVDDGRELLVREITRRNRLEEIKGTKDPKPAEVISTLMYEWMEVHGS